MKSAEHWLYNSYALSTRTLPCRHQPRLPQEHWVWTLLVSSTDWFNQPEFVMRLGCNLYRNNSAPTRSENWLLFSVPVRQIFGGQCLQQSYVIYGHEFLSRIGWWHFYWLQAVRLRQTRQNMSTALNANVSSIQFHGTADTCRAVLPYQSQTTTPASIPFH